MIAVQYFELALTEETLHAARQAVPHDPQRQLNVDFAYVSLACCAVYKRAPVTLQDRACKRVVSCDVYHYRRRPQADGARVEGFARALDLLCLQISFGRLS